MDNERLIKFGLRIRELRKRQGISQEKLAVLANMDRGYTGHVERGNRNVSINNIFKIADALGVDPGELFAPPGRVDDDESARCR